MMVDRRIAELRAVVREMQTAVSLVRERTPHLPAQMEAAAAVERWWKRLAVLDDETLADPARPHRLTWNGTEWVAPCGCRYHPDDDNGSHGGAPHVHLCEKHLAAAERTKCYAKMKGERGELTCTRESGHDGDHVAHGIFEIAGQWAAERPACPPRETMTTRELAEELRAHLRPIEVTSPQTPVVGDVRAWQLSSLCFVLLKMLDDAAAERPQDAPRSADELERVRDAWRRTSEERDRMRAALLALRAEFPGSMYLQDKVREAVGNAAVDAPRSEPAAGATEPGLVFSAPPDGWSVGEGGCVTDGEVTLALADDGTLSIDGYVTDETGNVSIPLAAIESVAHRKFIDAKPSLESSFRVALDLLWAGISRALEGHIQLDRDWQTSAIQLIHYSGFKPDSVRDEDYVARAIIGQSLRSEFELFRNRVVEADNELSSVARELGLEELARCDGAIADGIRILADALLQARAPIPMLLHCPECGTRHVDKGEFATKNHHTHACQNCGMTWRPAIGPTVGVQFLPGFKDEIAAESDAREQRFAELDELSQRVVKATGHDVSLDLQREIGELREANTHLRDALEFYADPETYHACSFAFDRPTGGYDDDFGDAPDSDGVMIHTPGKLAREALLREGLRASKDELDELAKDWSATDADGLDSDD